MGLFSKKKEARELNLPDSSLMFPELPTELSGEGYEDKTQGMTLPQLSATLPSLGSFEGLPALPSARIIERKPLSPMLQGVQQRPLNGMNEPRIEMANRSHSGPVFVKIDRFKDAMSSFDVIKKKLNETSSLLEKIKDGRRKEEEELERWTEELESIKSKISTIDKKIFSDLE